MSNWHCANILVCNTGGGRFKPFHYNDKYLSLNLANSVKTFMDFSNSIVNYQFDYLGYKYYLDVHKQIQCSVLVLYEFFGQLKCDVTLNTKKEDLSCEVCHKI